MSEGPIKAERAAWEPKRVTTNPKFAVHASRADLDIHRAHCGRALTSKTAFSEYAYEVTCSDCLAGLRADGEIE